MKGINFCKIFNYLIIFSCCFGFRLLFPNERWDVDTSRPWVWIKPCDYTTTIGENDLTEGDPLYSRTNISLETILESIIDDYNDVYGSYLSLELFPSDPDNPPSGSAYTSARAENRTITICKGSTGLAAGWARPTITDGAVTGCEIVYDEDLHEKAKSYLGVITHELGHCLGLDHPQEMTDAIMSYYSNGETIYRLAKDDKMGLRHLYSDSIDGVDLKEKTTFGLSCSFNK